MRRFSKNSVYPLQSVFFADYAAYFSLSFGDAKKGCEWRGVRATKRCTRWSVCDRNNSSFANDDLLVLDYIRPIHTQIQTHTETYIILHNPPPEASHIRAQLDTPNTAPTTRFIVEQRLKQNCADVVARDSKTRT